MEGGGRGSGGGGGGRGYLAARPGVKVGEDGGYDGNRGRDASADLLVDEHADFDDGVGIGVYGWRRLIAGVEVLALLGGEGERSWEC